MDSLNGTVLVNGWRGLMHGDSPYRPRVSRETRLLLTAGVMAVAALWLLARIRFPERPVTPNPVTSVLSQLASVPKHDDLAGEIAQRQARLEPSLLALDVPSTVVRVRTPQRGVIGLGWVTASWHRSR